MYMQLFVLVLYIPVNNFSVMFGLGSPSGIFHFTNFLIKELSAFLAHSENFIM